MRTVGSLMVYAHDTYVHSISLNHFILVQVHRRTLAETASSSM